MNKDQQQLEALQDIRKMMKDSSKFLSLSGLSGIIAGAYALIGAFAVHQLLKTRLNAGYEGQTDDNLIFKISLIGIAVLLLSITTAYFFSVRKAKKINQKLYDHTSKKVFWSMFIPLAAGGFFCCALLYHDIPLMVSPVMLLFYGLALFNSSKHTVPDIKVLGLLQIGLGLAASFIPEQGLLIWAVGFGVLHIIYGTIVWNKYDRNIS
jgi:uncharacterized Tic20 family protein